MLLRFFMKKLLLAGLVVSVAVVASAKNKFNEFFDLEKRSVKFFTETSLDYDGYVSYDKINKLSELCLDWEGYIACDKIMQLSVQERNAIKQEACSRANGSFDQHEVIISVILYNNIVGCEDETAALLSPGYFVRQMKKRQLQEIKESDVFKRIP